MVATIAAIHRKKRIMKCGIAKSHFASG